MFTKRTNKQTQIKRKQNSECQKCIESQEFMTSAEAVPKMKFSKFCKALKSA